MWEGLGGAPKAHPAPGAQKKKDLSPTHAVLPVASGVRARLAPHPQLLLPLTHNYMLTCIHTRMLPRAAHRPLHSPLTFFYLSKGPEGEGPWPGAETRLAALAAVCDVTLRPPWEHRHPSSAPGTSTGHFHLWTASPLAPGGLSCHPESRWSGNEESL